MNFWNRSFSFTWFQLLHKNTEEHTAFNSIYTPFRCDVCLFLNQNCSELFQWLLQVINRYVSGPKYSQFFHIVFLFIFLSALYFSMVSFFFLHFSFPFLFTIGYPLLVHRNSYSTRSHTWANWFLLKYTCEISSSSSVYQVRLYSSSREKFEFEAWNHLSFFQNIFCEYLHWVSSAVLVFKWILCVFVSMHFSLL